MSTALHALCTDTCWRRNPNDALLKFKTNEDMFRNEKCKVIFGVKYILPHWDYNSHCTLLKVAN